MAIHTFKIQVLDERGEARDVWKIENPSQGSEFQWQEGQVPIAPVNPNINYWVRPKTTTWTM
jgi:hypothetical protein